MSRMSHFGVVLLFHLPKFHSSMMLLCLRVLSHHHQSARVLDVDGFYGSLVILFVTCLGEQFLSLRMMPSWVTRVYSRGDGSRVCRLQVAGNESVSWRERLPHAHDFFLEVCCSRSLRPTAGGPKSTEDQANRDGQDAERRFRKLMRINKQSFDEAGGVHVDKDGLDVGAGDQGTRLGYASGGTGKIEVRTLMVRFEAAGKTTILFKVTNATIGFNVETVEYKNLIFTVWCVGGENKIRSL